MAGMADDLEVTDAPEGAPPEAEDPIPDPDTAGKWDEGTRNLVTKLREETKQYRQQANAAKPFREAFGAMPDQARDVFLDLARAYASGDLAGTASLATEIAAELTPAQRGEVAEQTGAAETDAPLTETKFNELMAQREQAMEATRQQERYTDEMQREARALGYDPDDMKNPDYTLLLQTMAAEGTTDVKRGHELVGAYKQSIVDGYRDAKAREAQNGRLVPDLAGGPGTRKVEIHSLKDAERAAKEWAAQQVGT